MANAEENQLQYPFGDETPALGEVIDIVPGVRWVRMTLPFALDHINLWLLRDRDEDTGREGWAIVDCGITNDTTRDAWTRIFEQHLDGLPVLRVIVTHMHPDHVGLAHWLTERWNCRLWISATDWNAARMASKATTGFGGETAALFFREHGLLDAASLDRVRARSNYYASMVPEVPRSFRRLLDAQVLRIGEHEWRCIAGYGHAPEHISLYCERLALMIAGDMVLPRISTNISVIDIEPEADPLPLYLRSLQELKALPEDTLVLPAHGRPFRGLHTRIDQLARHHDDRLAETLEACTAAPTSAAELLPVLFKRKLDLHQTTFAMGESIAHLHALAGKGVLRSAIDADGVRRFRPR
jgi:glyoxylase-like metal-dependent hydrolase (beta-lactamase superfamily II)